MKKRSTLYFLIATISVLMVIAGCAQQGNPSGGVGDVTPPRFVSVSPLSKSTNISVNRSISIQFNEWVEPASVKKAITIYPTLPGGFDLKVDRREITIVPNDSFAKNTTYHISVNGELADFYRNRLVEPVNCVFSTGSTIDSGMITGGAVTENEKDNSSLKAVLFFESRFDSTLDTTLLSEPDYLVQCDSLDRFTFENINENSYRLVAFRDKNSDNRVTPGETVYFPKSQTISSRMVSEIILYKGSSDTTRWKISKVEQVSSTILKGTVSPVRLPDSAIIVLVESQKIVKLKSSHILSDSSTILFTAESPIPSGQYTLISWWPNRFTAGKNLPKNDTLPYTSVISDSVRFNAVPPSDSTKIRFLGWKIIDEKMISPQLKLSWSNPVAFIATLEFSDSSGNRYPLILEQSPEKELSFRMKGKLPSNQKLSLTLKSSLFKGINNGNVTIQDSVVDFKTFDDKDMALSLLLSYPNCKPYYSWNWELSSALRGNSVSIPLKRVNNDLVAEDIPAANYTVSLFEDLNSNGVQDRGSLFPRVSGETRIFLQDTIKVKARWRTELALETTCSLLKLPMVKKVDSTSVDTLTSKKNTAK